MQARKLQPMASPKNYTIPSYIMYVDEIIVFCRGTVKSIKELVNLFYVDDCVSGQIISHDKSIIYHGNINQRCLLEISRILGFRYDLALFGYLGVPIFKGKPRRCHL